MLTAWMLASWPSSFPGRVSARTLRETQHTRRCVAKAEKLVAQALGRVLARNVSAGRSAEFPELLRETDAELAAMQERLKRDARMLRRARKQVRETRLQIAATALFRAGPPGDSGQEPRSPYMTLVPRWHPEHPSNN